eukprot:COSAG05_NODE_493_length_9295_cov_27.013158_6_plen_97_part_00
MQLVEYITRVYAEYTLGGFHGGFQAVCDSLSLPKKRVSYHALHVAWANQVRDPSHSAYEAATHENNGAHTAVTVVCETGGERCKNASRIHLSVGPT